MKTKSILIVGVMILCAVPARVLKAWGNKNTHRALTAYAVNESVLAKDYLEKQLGLKGKLETKLIVTVHSNSG